MEKKANLKTKWDLTNFYKSAKDPQIEKDVKSFEQLCDGFAKRYAGKPDYLNSETKLLKALQDYETLDNKLNDGRPLLYFHYVTSLNSSDEYAQAQISKLTNIITSAGNKLVFFPLALGKIPIKRQKQYLSSPKLKKYRYLLKTRFENAKYDLSEPEEKILNLKSLPSHSLWVSGLEKSINKKTVKFKGKDLPLPEASNLLSELGTNERRALHTKLMEVYEEVSDFAESELNAVVTDHKINDGLKGLPKPYSARVLSAENDERAVLALVDSVTQSFSLSKRFYKVKAKLLKQKRLKYADRAAKVGKFNKKYNFNRSYEILLNTYSQYDGDFSKILETMLNNGQIDVYPKKGKSGGAFCSSSNNNPTLVLLNHTNTFNSVSTFAHEIGHAIHSELSKTQPIFYQGYSLSSAETASTFFEGLVFDELVKDLSDEQKIIALHDKIQDEVNTIFRQVACFNFELELHMQIRELGALSKEELAKLMNKHMKSYLGPIFDFEDLDGYFFVQWSHIRNFFYVYTYAYGNLVSKALQARVKEDPKSIKDVKAFLEAGGSDTPENIFKSIGIDVTKPQFWKDGLKEIEGEIKELENLVK